VADQLDGMRDPRLRAMLGARSGNYGAVPSQAPFNEHALVTTSYDAGAYYPVGGPGRFAQTLRVPVEAAGGGLRVSADVQRIRVRDGRAAGVSFEHGGQRHEALAHTVISDIGVTNTVARLDPDSAHAWRQTVGGLPPGAGFVGLYRGFDGDIRAAAVEPRLRPRVGG